MALNIISNFAANVAHRNLVKTDLQTTSSLSKLSSGTRVVSAKDDAASLAIGSRLRAEVEGLKQASVNAGQAGSLLQIADGALATVSDILVRAKSLAVQAASGQLGQTERTVLDSEFQSLKNEITRISTDTEFNGTALISGAAENTTTASSALSGIGITSVSFDPLVNTTTGNTFRLTFDQSTKVLTATYNAGDGTVGTQAVNLTSQVTAINALTGNETLGINFGTSGLTVNVNANFNTAADINASIVNNTVVANNSAISTLDVTTTVPTFGTAVTNTVVSALTSLVSLDGNGAGYNATTGVLRIAAASTTTDNEINFKGIAGVSFNAIAAGTDSGALTNGDAVAVKVSGVTVGTFTVNTVAGTAGTAAVQGGFVEVNIGQGLVFNTFNATSGDSAFTFKVGTGTNTAADDLTFTLQSASATALGINGDVITSAAAANTASTNVSTAIDSVNSRRSTIGAAQNRLGFATANLAASTENTEAARSQLLDLDLASEISVLTSKQVLLQAGVSTLAQANQIPQNLLRLLQ